MTQLRIATRKSPLALWQANHVKNKLMTQFPHLQVVLVEFMTEGDQRLDDSLALIGGKGLFVKELEKALLRHEADIAVHSIKDMPFTLPSALTLAAVCEREDPRDAFVSNAYQTVDQLPKHAIVGTSSARRTCLLKSHRPDLNILPLRGNVGTRLNKLDTAEYDAIILAAAGLKRLSEAGRIKHFLEVDDWIPAPGQGAIGIECRKDDALVLEYVAALEHVPTRVCITAERSVNQTLEGGCQLPLAVHARWTSDQTIFIHGFVGNMETNQRIIADIEGNASEAERLGQQLAQTLLDLGAKRFLQR